MNRARILSLLGSPRTICAALLFILLIPFCNLMFLCGCRPIWAGAMTHCNAFRAGDPDCPFCLPKLCASCDSALIPLQFLPLAAAYAPAWLAMGALKRTKTDYWLQMVAGLALMISTLLMVGYIYGRLSGYPYFLIANYFVSIR